MASKSFAFPQVTLLITHYNRSLSLERLLTVFQELNCHFAKIIVSDDCSKGKHVERLAELQKRFQFELVSTPVNGGLGKNINKGQDQVSTPYTLYVQEDFEPTELFPPKLEEALAFMQQDPTLDLVRFYAFFEPPIKEPFAKGFSKLKFNWLHPSHIKFYLYSDHPHLRRSDFLEKFGRYTEGEGVDLTEMNTALRFIHRGGQALFYDQFSSLFYHERTTAETSTRTKPSWRLSSNPFIRLLRLGYLRVRWVKNSWQLLRLNWKD